MSKEAQYFVVSIYLRGDRLDPVVVSNELGLQPWKSQKKGEVLQGVKPIVARIGLWNIRSEIKSTSIKDHLDDLLKSVEKYGSPLNKIEGVAEGYLDIFYAFDDNERRTVEFFLTREHIEAIERAGLSVQFTVS